MELVQGRGRCGAGTREGEVCSWYGGGVESVAPDRAGTGGGVPCCSYHNPPGISEDLVTVEGSVWPEMSDLETLFESRAGMVITEIQR